MAKIRNKTTLMFLTVVLIATLGVGFLLLWRSQLLVKNEALQKLDYQAQLLASNFDSERLSLATNTDLIEAFIRSNFPEEGLNANNVESFKLKTRRFFESATETMQPFSLWMVLAPEIPTTEHNVALYRGKSDGNYILEEGYDMNSMDLNDPSIEWFTKAVEFGEVWTLPYRWESWNLDLISYSRALYIGEQLIGCIGSDFNFTKKSIEWTETKIYETGYLYLVSQDLNFIFHPRFSKAELEEFDQQGLTDEVKRKRAGRERGYLEYEIAGEKRFTAFRQMPNGWILFITVPQDEVLASIRKMKWEFSLIILFVSIFSVFISTRFSRTITIPINTLVTTLGNARKGELDSRSNVQTNDELQTLSEQFNYFLSELQKRLSELSKKEKDLVQAKERAEKSDQLKTSFLNNLSHEIRTPLNGIVGCSESLIEQDYSESERQELYDIINSNNEKLLHYIDATLTSANLEQNQITPNWQKLPFSRVVDVLTQEFYRVAKKKSFPSTQYTISNDVPIEEGFSIENDPELLRQIVGILADNSFKFTNEGIVELNFYSGESDWGFFVKDTGIGIPESMIPHVFEKFLKEESEKDVLYEGLGLGLSIAQTFSELLSGNISVESTLGKGSVFKVCFPVSPTRS